VPEILSRARSRAINSDGGNMDKQDADRALDAALTDLEQSRSGADREQMAALLAAVVLIGRRLVPAQSTASDATQPGRRTTRYRAGRDGSLSEIGQSDSALYPGPAAPRVDPPRKERRWVDEQGRARRDMVPADEPTPALRALFTGEPIPDEGPEPVGALAWSRDEGERIAEADSLLAKDRAELSATLTQLEAERRKTAALQRVIDDARGELARAIGVPADATLTWLVSENGQRLAEEFARGARLQRRLSETEIERVEAMNSRDSWIRSFSRVAEVLGCPAGEPSVLAAISTLKDNLRVAKEERHTALRNSLRDVLGLPGNALDSVIVAKVREAGVVLAEAHKTIDAARATLTTTLAPGPCPTGQTLPMLPDLVARAVTHIEVLRSEHAHERTTVDELRGLVQEVREEADGALAEMAEHRERWERVRPLLAALESWATSPPGRDADTPLAGEFDRWQIAEAQANEDGPADVPHQPDDPGVEEPEDVGAMGGDAP
jgi:hypothetical protein